MRQYAQIITVDPSKRRIDGRLRDGSFVQIGVQDQSATFRWPVEGEIWSIESLNQGWVLGARLTTADEEFRIEDLDPGDALIDSSKIVNKDGARLLTEQDIQDITGDKTFVHTQLASASTWYVNHNMGKKPSVTVVDSADTVVIGEVTYLSDDTLEVSFTSPFGGKVYLN